MSEPFQYCKDLFWSLSLFCCIYMYGYDQIKNKEEQEWHLPIKGFNITVKYSRENEEVGKLGFFQHLERAEAGLTVVFTAFLNLSWTDATIVNPYFNLNLSVFLK